MWLQAQWITTITIITSMMKMMRAGWVEIKKLYLIKGCVIGDVLSFTDHFDHGSYSMKSYCMMTSDFITRHILDFLKIRTNTRHLGQYVRFHVPPVWNVYRSYRVSPRDKRWILEWWIRINKRTNERTMECTNERTWLFLAGFKRNEFDL